MNPFDPHKFVKEAEDKLIELLEDQEPPSGPINIDESPLSAGWMARQSEDFEKMRFEDIRFNA